MILEIPVFKKNIFETLYTNFKLCACAIKLVITFIYICNAITSQCNKQMVRNNYHFNLHI